MTIVPFTPCSVFLLYVLKLSHHRALGLLASIVRLLFDTAILIHYYLVQVLKIALRRNFPKVTQFENCYILEDLFLLEKCLMRFSHQEFIGLGNSS
jgi:hypothetical protein